MPELPEVEVVRAGLAPAVIGARVLGASVLDERALRRHDGDAADFEAAVSGRYITAAVRRGKFIWLPLDGGTQAVVGHLGMSGQMLLREAGAPTQRHERIRVALEHPEHGELAVVFADQRLFGSLALDRLVPTSDGHAAGRGSDAAVIPAQVAHIARDALDPAFSDTRFREMLSRKRSGIKRVLLDQTVASGVGNIYADEALWAARLHPETPATELSTRAVNRLLAEVRAVLERALAEGGTSFDTQYVNVNGEAGYFSRYLHAYGRQDEPCNRCAGRIERVKFMNRSSYFCPRCQRLPRVRSSLSPRGAHSSH